MTDEKALKVVKWLEQFNAADLDLIARLVWKARQKNFAESDKQIHGTPYYGRKTKNLGTKGS